MSNNLPFRFKVETEIAERIAIVQDDANDKVISPAHYKEILPGYEYMDMMVFMLKDFEGVEAHLMGQIYKYLMRYGKKDNKNQELKKVRWYLNYLIAYNTDPEEVIDYDK